MKAALPPVSPYGTFAGELFQYARNLVAFESRPSATESNCNDPSNDDYCTHKCILLGGLSDGLLPVPYTQALLEDALPSKWSLVQPLLSSSYTGFGHGSLDRDVSELIQLLTYLRVYRHMEHFCLVGHSTGCQCIVHYLRQAWENEQQQLRDNNPASNTVDTCLDACRLAVLQAPVSDREHAQNMDDGYQDYLHLAQSMKNADEMMPRAAFWCPVTAQRYLDLHARGGRDDYFSSDYTDAELRARLSHVGAIGKQYNNQNSEPTTRRQFRCLVAFSGSDEYVHVDSRQLTQRLVQAMNHGADNNHDDKDPVVAHALYLPNANHNLSVGEVDVFVQTVADMIQQVTALN